jgi:hypothetical protein
MQRYGAYVYTIVKGLMSSEYNHSFFLRVTVWNIQIVKFPSGQSGCALFHVLSHPSQGVIFLIFLPLMSIYPVSCISLVN